MAQKYDILYVNFYTDGTAARQVAPAFPAVQPKRKVQTKAKKKRITVFLDPVAVCSILVAAVLLVMMAVGLNQFQAVREEAQAMEAYVTQLTLQNEELTQKYHSGMNLAEIEQTALALGMVPKDQVQTIPIQVQTLEQQPQQDTWYQIGAFLANLFA